MTTVTWRRVIAALTATVLVLGALVVVFRSNGLPAVDVAASRATRWFVHQPTGRVVLADGYGGRALASLDAGSLDGDIRVIEGGAGAYLVNDTLGEVRAIDAAALRLGPAQGLTPLTNGRALAGVGSSGLVVIDADAGDATLLPVSGETVGFDVDVDESARIAPDGAIWSLRGSQLVRTTSGGAVATPLGTSIAETAVGAASSLSLVGSVPLVIDREGRRVRLGTGAWQELPSNADPSEFILQQSGPAADCGWVGANDNLWCVSPTGLQESAQVDGLDIDGSDLLAIAGDAAALIRRAPASIVRFDWREGVVQSDDVATVSGSAQLSVSSTVDLVWVDDVDGQFVWAINPWGIRAIDKNGGSILVLGEDGEIIDDGDGTGRGGSGSAGDDGVSEEPDEREPDNNGIDDPPVAVDDPVTARTGRAIPVPVTANDYDPDGEAIAVVAVGAAGHGSVEIGTASTVVYSPEPGYVGLDEFSYTIADGDGTEASANVIVELIALDATNRPPVGAPDEAETGAGVPVVVDVLLNDIDPERDPVQIGSFRSDALGEVTETVGPSGLGALRFEPIDGFEGTAMLVYRPVDSFGALGDDVSVTVEVASADDDNRPPIVRPDSLRLRRGVETPLAVLVNDEDPDGDRLTLSVVEPLAEGLSVEVQGEQLSVIVRAGSEESIPFEYAVDDGNGHVVNGAVLVDVIDDVEPNRPPVVVADADTVVVGRTVVLDVLANDTDPDGDPLVVVDVTQPEGERGQAVALAPDQVQFTPAVLDDEEDTIARFTYTVDDGNGHQTSGDITITVLPEPLPEPPFAQDDSTFTFVDEPVTIDVLRNDGDPSGERPRLVGSPGCPSGGSAVVTAAGQVRYVPPLGRSGAFRCTYEVTNSQGLRASASIIVSVREPEVTNEPPNAILDQLIVEVGETQTIDVTLNDDDPDGDSSELEVVSSTAPSIGDAVRTGNSITFTAGDETGITAINYQVADEAGAVSLGRVSIRITEKANVPPVANADSRTINGPGVPVSIDVLENDFDPNDSANNLTVVSADVLSGPGLLNQTGSIITITPDADYEGDVVATYTIRDAGGLTSSAQITLTVLPPLNRPPVANDDSADVNNGGSVTTPVLFNDSDPDGDQLSLTITGAPDSGLGSANTNGSAITFNANPGAAGTAAISYSVSDGEFSDSATLFVNVRPCSESFPIAQDAFLSTGYQQPIAIDLNTFSANGTIVDVTGPAGYNGSVYTPAAGQNSNVGIRYAVVNSCRQRAEGQITIDVNQDPVPQPVAVSLARGDTLAFPVSTLAGDDEALIITATPGAPNWATADSSSLVISVPLTVPIGLVAWSVTVTDPGGLTASVPISVTVTNNDPRAVNDAIDVSSGTVVFDIVDNDSDPDGDSGDLRIQSVPSTITFENGETGSVSIIGPRQRRVQINPLGGRGAASFTYQVVDADGAVSPAATVSVTGPDLNIAPITSNQTVDVIVGEPQSFILLASDADNDTLSVEILDDPSGLVGAISDLSITVTALNEGSATFTYRVNDGIANSAAATVTIIATPPPTTTMTPTTTTTTTTTEPPDTTTTLPDDTTTTVADTTTTLPDDTTTTLAETAPPTSVTESLPPADS